MNANNGAAQMKTIYRNNDLRTLQTIADALNVAGFVVYPIVVPENEIVDGVPYFSTNATNRQIMDARRAV